MNLRLLDTYGIFLVLLLFILLSVFSSLLESLTYDEPVHIQMGIEAYAGEFSTDPYNPPLSTEISVLPVLYGFRLPGYKPYEVYFFGRLMNIFMAALTIYAVYIFTRVNFSPKIAYIAAIILAFEPTFLGHSHYITFDIATTLFIFLTFISLLKLWKGPAIFDFIHAGIMIGLACAVRVLSIPVIGAMVLITILTQLSKVVLTMQLFFRILVATVSALMVLWGVYFFSVDVVVKGQPDESRLSQRLLANNKYSKFLATPITFLQTQPIPFGQYVALVKNNVIRGNRSNSWFFMGEYRNIYHWYYLPITLILKLPIPLLLGILLGSIVIYSRKKIYTHGKIITLIPVCIVSILILTRTIPLVRYALPALPFLVILAAIGLSYIMKKKYIFILFLLSLWYLGGTLSYFPHFISFANELSGPRNGRYQLFGDSNLDWGQGLLTLYKYIQSKRPHSIEFSYFGQDDATLYGFPSNTTYTSWKEPDVCRIHKIDYPQWQNRSLVVVSVSNWYSCGYYKQKQFDKDKIIDYVADSFLIYEIQYK